MALIWDLWPCVLITPSWPDLTHHHQHRSRQSGIDYRCLICQLSIRPRCHPGETIFSSTSSPPKEERNLQGNRNKSKSDMLFSERRLLPAEQQAAVSQAVRRDHPVPVVLNNTGRIQQSFTFSWRLQTKDWTRSFSETHREVFIKWIKKFNRGNVVGLFMPDLWRKYKIVSKVILFHRVLCAGFVPQPLWLQME